MTVRSGLRYYMLDQIVRPRIDDLVYSITASIGIGEPSNIERTIKSLLIACPNFNAASFVDGLPYERTQDRNLVLRALEEANLNTTN